VGESGRADEERRRATGGWCRGTAKRRERIEGKQREGWGGADPPEQEFREAAHERGLGEQCADLVNAVAIYEAEAAQPWERLREKRVCGWEKLSYVKWNEIERRVVGP